MKLRPANLLTVPLLAGVLSCGLARAQQPAKPNVVVILVDDMGFSDIGCYGSEIPTPNLDKLAGGGVRFTQFYNGARCCPTRASLLTGLYAHQTGVGHMVEDNGEAGYRGRLNEQCVTMAEALRPAGYFTIMWYATDLWTDFAIKFVDEALAAKKPFYLHLCHNAPHFPLQAPAEDIAKFRGKYLVGWDKLREQRHAKQVELGIVDKAWPLAPRPNSVKAWDSLGADEQDKFDHMMAIYAACVNHMDTAVGRLVEALRQRGVLDNTLILFLSDNGGNAESGPNGRLVGDPPGSPKSDVYCGESWAMLENTPFRRYKHFDHEGGIATPLIAHWPAGIAARGELRQQVGHIIDIMPTFLDVAGASYPQQRNGQATPPLEGKSLLAAFANKPLERDALYWEHEGNAAIRVGDWKLVRLGRNGPWELYNLKTDRTELHNLATDEPARAQELSAKWDAWAERAKVKPFPNEGKKAAAAGGNKTGKP